MKALTAIVLAGLCVVFVALTMGCASLGRREWVLIPQAGGDGQPTGAYVAVRAGRDVPAEPEPWTWGRALRWGGSLAALAITDRVAANNDWLYYEWFEDSGGNDSRDSGSGSASSQSVPQSVGGDVTQVSVNNNSAPVTVNVGNSTDNSTAEAAPASE